MKTENGHIQMQINKMKPHTKIHTFICAKLKSSHSLCYVKIIPVTLQNHNVTFSPNYAFIGKFTERIDHPGNCLLLESAPCLIICSISRKYERSKVGASDIMQHTWHTWCPSFYTERKMKMKTQSIFDIHRVFFTLKKINYLGKKIYKRKYTI